MPKLTNTPIPSAFKQIAAGRTDTDNIRKNDQQEKGISGKLMIDTGSEQAWAEGYVVRFPYRHHFYSELTPAMLSLVTLIQGFRPPAADRPFTYMELGCGSGFSANLLAAANPKGRFYANDFIPTQISRARALSEECGIPNIGFLEKSFAELSDSDLPEFDFITLHNVYSWINEESRRDIIRFIRNKLKTGGIVYLNYLSLPGQAPFLPVRRLLTEFVNRAGGTIESRIRSALNHLEKLEGAGLRYFSRNAVVGEGLNTMKNVQPIDILHEFLNENYNVFYRSDIIKEMEDAKLTFIGSSNIAENFDHYSLPPAIQEFSKEIEDPDMKLTIKEFALNKSHGTAIFVRGPYEMNGQERNERFMKTRFALCVPRANCLPQANISRGMINLTGEIYSQITDGLAKGPATLLQLAEIPSVRAYGAEALLQAVLNIIVAGYIRPAIPDEMQEQEHTRLFNEAVFRYAAAGTDLPAIASPVLGSGVNADRFQKLFLLARRENRADVPGACWEMFSKTGLKLVKDGSPIERPEDNLSELGRKYRDEFIGNFLPFYQGIGIE
ncbi:class I SAM-dependent methyltransferase [Desulfococcaceae bacterium HSG8]|nr:class I SAM-dependent methyltransferase [Desulfococcaceae bacterium HSG8]